MENENCEFCKTSCAIALISLVLDSETDPIQKYICRNCLWDVEETLNGFVPPELEPEDYDSLDDDEDEDWGLNLPESDQLDTGCDF